jgi:hypothetical protein
MRPIYEDILVVLARAVAIGIVVWVGWYWFIAMAWGQDYDQRWIERNIRKTERHLERHEAPRYERPPHHAYPRRPVERARRHDPPPPRVVYRDRPKPPHEPHYPPGPRVYGVEIRTPQRVERDILSNVECMPPIRELSHEYLTEEAAWKGAQLAWENKSRWLYGERFMNIHHALNMVKRCNKSTAAQSAGGRAVEIVAGAIGQDGHKNRCEIIASPCMAPEEINPDRKR